MIYPVLGQENTLPYAHLDLSKLYIPPATPILVMNHLLGEYVERFRDESEGIPYGGFLERRNIYLSPHFGMEEKRNIHLGIDLWVDPYTKVFAAKDGRIHSAAYNPADLDYGWCVIVEYDQDEFVLYGHLAHDLVDNYFTDTLVKKGDILAYTGDYAENGGWYPHLHLQVMNSMLNFIGDFPGVSTENDIEFYKKIIKDPFYLL
jgi:murein DD-endopeptidase MepM/ murein hydrolase activator NlpD